MSFVQRAVRLGALLVLAIAPSARGTPPPASLPPCSGVLASTEVVRCTLAQDLDLLQAQKELAALVGRRRAAGTWLPGHPLLSLTLAERRRTTDASEDSTLDWRVALSQEIEIAGQRGVRLDVADAEAAAQVRRVAVAAREAAAAALTAYYELLAAGEELHLAEQTAQVAQALSALAAGRARESLLSPVDADVALAEASRIGLSRFEATRRQAAAQAALTSLLGLTVPSQVTGSLDAGVPVPPEAQADQGADSLTARALVLRGEVAAADMEHRALQSRVRLLRRERVPNLTLSVFGGREEFTDRVLGAGLSLPLPLPSPVGPGRAGEIAEAQARAEGGQTALAAIRRRVRREVMQALAAERSQRAALLSLPADLMTRLPEDLRAISQALLTGRLPVREALLAQRSLIELSQAGVRIRLAYALARVELLRAAGLPFAGGAQP